MSDLIDRQQAIDVLKNRWLKTRNYEGIGEDIAEECEIYLRTVPSAQFATDTNVGTKLGTNLAQVGTDCISRQAVLDAIDDIESEVADGFGFQYEKWRKHFAELPPTEPKRGKWIYHIDDLFPAESTMECNQCHAEQPLICDDEFCPHCGADMRGGQK